MSPTGFKIAGAIRSRLHTIFQQIDRVPAKDLELMASMVRDAGLPAGWLDRTIGKVKTDIVNEAWSA